MKTKIVNCIELTIFNFPQRYSFHYLHRNKPNITYLLALENRCCPFPATLNLPSEQFQFANTPPGQTGSKHISQSAKTFLPATRATNTQYAYSPRTFTRTVRQTHHQSKYRHLAYSCEGRYKVGLLVPRKIHSSPTLHQSIYKHHSLRRQSKYIVRLLSARANSKFAYSPTGHLKTLGILATRAFTQFVDWSPEHLHSSPTLRARALTNTTRPPPKHFHSL